MDVPTREWHPRHDLTRVTVEVEIDRGRPVTIKSTGRAFTKRANLWIAVDHLEGPTDVLGAVDRCSMVLLRALQDRPTSQRAWDAIGDRENRFQTESLF